MILPRVKKYTEKTGAFSKNIIFDGNCDISIAAAELIKYFSFDLICERGCKPNIFFEKGDFAEKGRYSLIVSENEINVVYADFEGMRNAIASLVQLKTEVGIKCAEISDWPDNTFRSGMFDLARGYVEIDVLREHLIRMSLMKFNYVHLHLMDRQSYVLESEIVPNPDGHRLYSKTEMSEIAAFCKVLGLEVIPEIEIPAHGVNQIKALPELGCDIIDKKKAYDIIKSLDNGRKIEFIDNKKCVSAWVVCAGKESAYKIYDRIIKEIAEIFDGEYIHIGGDELEFLNLGAHPHWENCTACQKKMQDENLKGRRELYYYVVRRMYDIVKKYGRKMIMWNDQLDVSAPIDIPKDIIIEYWNGGVISSDEGVYQKLLDMGFKTINAEYKYTYVDFPEYMNEEKIRTWNTYKEYTGEGKLEGDIIGGEMCAWEMGNPLYSFYAHSLPVCAVVFADRVWNNQPTAYDEEYKQRVFAVMSGCFECNVNPLQFFKEILPPRNRDKNFLEDVEMDGIDVKKFELTICAMKGIQADKVYGKQALSKFIECMEYINDFLN